MSNLSTYLTLLGLTGLSVLLSRHMAVSPHLPRLLIALAGAKFLLVTFLFMEIRSAHPAWKAGITSLTLLLLAILLLVL